MVPEVGLEPTRPYGHKILSLARLPIPPLRHGGVRSSKCKRWPRPPQVETAQSGPALPPWCELLSGPPDVALPDCVSFAVKK